MTPAHETYFNEGIAFQDQGKYEDSLVSFQKAIDTQPNFIPAWIYKGISLEKLKRYEEAIACYEQATKIHPEVADLWYNKGATYCKIKRYPDALTCFERVLQIEPDHALARTAQAFVLATPPVYTPNTQVTEVKPDKKTSEEATETALKLSSYIDEYGTEMERD